MLAPFSAYFRLVSDKHMIPAHSPPRIYPRSALYPHTTHRGEGRREREEREKQRRRERRRKRFAL